MSYMSEMSAIREAALRDIEITLTGAIMAAAKIGAEGQRPAGDLPAAAAADPPAAAPAAAGPAPAVRPTGPVQDAEQKVTCHYCSQQVPAVEIEKVHSITGIHCCLKCSKKSDIVDQWKRNKV